MTRYLSVPVAIGFVAALCACASPERSESGAKGADGAAKSDSGAPTLFDDFTYTSAAEMERNGWILRTKPGWPGVPGASWTGNVEVGVPDAASASNRLVRMRAITDGTKTRQAQFCHQRKYDEGTYAARVRFSDAPVSGPDGDQIVQTFYTIAPLKSPLDTDYSELDFEYLPNGGWGSGELTLFVTTWETFHPEPKWLQINKSTNVQSSRNGWRTLVLQVAGGEATYFIDGEKLGTHGGPYYPEEPMSINFNLWFIRDQLVKSSARRTYAQEVDWVFHEAGSVLSPAQVRERVAAFQQSGVAFRDTVPARDPPLDSPCDF